MNDIELRETTLRWDIEYWQQYLYSLESGLVHNQTQVDIDETKSALAAAKKAYSSYITEYAEHFI